MRTEADLDRRHDEIVARFPGGLTYDQFIFVTLESADEKDDGRVYPHTLADFFQRQSWLLGMSMIERLLDHWDDGSGKPRMHQPMRYKINDKGRQWLADNRARFAANAPSTV